jgi:hypothetical protein
MYDFIRIPRAAQPTDPKVEVTFEDTQGSATGFFVGVDLGQSKDFTAVVVNERVEAERVRLERSPFQPVAGEVSRQRLVRHRFSFLHRFQLGTPYPEIVDTLGRLLKQLPQRRDAPALYVDATGVGRPVIDTMRGKGLHPVGITITAGLDVNRKAFNDIRIPKRNLASLMQVVLQTERLKIAEDMPMTPVLVRELEAFKVKISAAGNEGFEAWREADHDDLVLAAAIAVWGAENRPQPIQSLNLNYMAR